MDRTLGAGKPVDPATRLSELLAQSLEELTRPFDAPKGGAHQTGPHPARPSLPDPAIAQPLSPEAAAHDLLPKEEPPPEPSLEETRIDADKALAELEAELFAAARQVDNDASIAHPEEKSGEEPEAGDGQGALDHAGQPEALAAAPDSESTEKPAEPTADKIEAAPAESAPPPPLAPADPVPDADAAAVIAKVRRLMLVSMAVTLIAVSAVFGFVGYRLFKTEGTTAKTADKLPPSSPIPNEVTLSLPRGARVVQSSVANDRLLITLEIDGKPEVRTFDVRTLQPTGRLDFSSTP